MAASLQNIVRAACRVSPAVLQRIHRAQNGVRVVFVTPVRRQVFNSARLACEGLSVQAVETHSRYKDTPWEYLESEEYIERYGSRPVWTDYRRNHKGGIPPQKTRKTCIRGDKICGNPCPICRDPNIIIHYQNVNLLQQFISPHTGMVYDPTRTGVCMKQQKLLNKAIETARDHGLIPTHLPLVDYSGEDFSNSHGAVGRTPLPHAYTHGEPWYAWYGDIEPDERELARVKKIYKPYLK
ncbi:small ribosomal subunit protein mS40 [Clarias gariepinus]|uniref:28S ribosomal protein S18b, mitochondrial n=1 Tax=Clarias gariepinus TaxID=13013 RepID=UPI00234E0060|nr:28S ribosomal protein S18b, mitochondrial [Clarias gariepinus]